MKTLTILNDAIFLELRGKSTNNIEKKFIATEKLPQTTIP